MIDRIVHEIRMAMSHELYLSALALALTLPDTCGKAEYPNEDYNGVRYKNWCSQYVITDENARAIHSQMKEAEKRMKVITGIQKAVADCQSHQAIRDKYLSIGWKVRKEAYAESHKDELDGYNKAFRYLKKQGVDLNVNLDALQAEYDGLRKSCAELSGQLATVKENLKPMKDIRYWVSKVLTSEQAEVQKMPEPKHSVTERLRSIEQQKRNQSETQLTQKKKQNQEH